MSTVIGIDKTSLTDKIYNHLLQRIINNDMRPGTRINYEDLIEDLKVSRTPLREAINRLSDDGLIEIKPRSGTFVRVPDKKGIKNVYDIRMALEELSVERAIENIPDTVLKNLKSETFHAEKELEKGNVDPFFQADRNFHNSLIKYADNEILSNFWKTIEAQIQWYGVIMTTNKSRPVQANEMHKLIIDSLLERNREASKKNMRQHIIEIRDNMLKDNLIE